MGNSERAAADDQQQTAFPLNISGAAPTDLAALHADAAGHHQGHRFQRLENPKQDGAPRRAEKAKPGQTRKRRPRRTRQRSAEHSSPDPSWAFVLSVQAKSVFERSMPTDLIRGSMPVRLKKMRQSKESPVLISTEPDEALVVRQRRPCGVAISVAHVTPCVERSRSRACMRAVEHDAGWRPWEGPMQETAADDPAA